MKRLITICVVVALLLVVAGPVTAVPTDYYIWDDWGGAWADAEKTLPNTEDDLMCWAAAASNILEWTGWGKVGGMTNTDQMFAHFQDHWTDDGGLMEYAWEWWFDGTYNGPTVPDWSQPDVPGGGGFYPSLNFKDYFHETWNPPQALSAIDQYLHAGYGTTLGIYDGGHAITCWGYRYDSDTGAYLGVWLTDSDNSKVGPAPRPDTINYYDVVLSGGMWYLQDFYGTNDYWYIEGVQALAIPEPATIALFGFGGLVLLHRRRG